MRRICSTRFRALAPSTLAVALVVSAACGGSSASRLLVIAESSTTTEAGAQAIVTVALSEKPDADVIVPIGSSDISEATVGTAAVTFTRENWNAPQRITVTGVDDLDTDGTQPFDIVAGPSTSEDTRFTSLSRSVSLTNQDDDSPGFMLSTVSRDTNEAGATATFTLRLTTPPTADVVVTLTSDDTSEGVVSPMSLTFTSLNWNAPQAVTITGVDDVLVDGARTYAINIASVTTTDPTYASVALPTGVSVTNLDNETAGISVVASASLTTSESGSTAGFSVVLTSRPNASVTLALTTTEPTEGIASPSSLVFTTDNWNAPQIVTVVGQNDSKADGSQGYAIEFTAPTSTDPAYATLAAPASIPLTNLDNDTAGITVIARANLITTESGGQATFTVVLRTQPSDSVMLSLTSSAPDEGSVSSTPLTFTTDNWNAPQTVTITGVNDEGADGGQSFHIDFAAPTSTDAGYAALAAFAGPTATNMDNDSPGMLVAAAPSLTTSESGAQASFTVVLTSQPTADVTVNYASTATDEGAAAPSSLLFTTSSWNVEQTVTVTGANDDVADGGQVYFVAFSALTSADTGYASLTPPPSISITNTDNDTPGFTVVAGAALSTTESGGTAMLTVVLNTQPTANVTLSVSSNATDEGTVSPTSLLFTSANWNVPHQVTITGVDDLVADGGQPYSVIFGAPTSADAGYALLPAPASVPVTNADNDTPGFAIALGLSTTTSEAGNPATFTVALTSQPTANVTLSFASSAPLEGVVTPTSFTFTSANWSTPRTATVTGQNDAVTDGNQQYNIVFMAPTSTDALYAALSAPASIVLTNIDNDVASPTISAPTTVELTSTSQTTVSFGGYLNGESFQQDGILTHNGYQYAAYWSAAAHVMLARRPSGTGTWTVIELDPEYVGTSGDAHNTISLGVSPQDGRLHVAFDHHGSNLHYNYSVAALVSNPGSAVWATSSFQPGPTSVLSGTTVTLVTYPRFITTPSAKMLLSYRFGTSGSGDEVLWEYDGSTATWTRIGTYISGIPNSVNAYLHGLEYSGTRLHAAWCWRDTPNASTNHGLFYIYSDDDGRTWKDNSGATASITGTSFISLSSPGIEVWPIGQNRGLINQEHMTVDSAGRVHVLLSHMPDAQADDSDFTSARTKSQFFHYWRDTNGLWRRTPMTFPVVLNFRGKLAVTSTNNLYAVLPNLRIASASASTAWTNWTIIDSSLAGQYFSDPLIDRAQLRVGNTLTVFAPAMASGGAVAIDTINFTVQ